MRTVEDAVLNAMRTATAGYDQMPERVTDPLEWAAERVTVERILSA